MTAAQHYARLLDMPCIVTGVLGVTRHHIVGCSAVERLGVRGQRKHSDWLALPLAVAPVNLHQGPQGIHAGCETWEAIHGKQTDLIDKLGQQLGLDLWALAAQEAADERAERQAKPIKKRSRKYTPPSKQVPRRAA